MLVACVKRFYYLSGVSTTDIKYSLDFLHPIRTAEAFEAVDWLHQQTWLHCGIAYRDSLDFCKSLHLNVRISVMFSSTIIDV